MLWPMSKSFEDACALFLKLQGIYANLKNKYIIDINIINTKFSIICKKNVRGQNVFFSQFKLSSKIENAIN